MAKKKLKVNNKVVAKINSEYVDSFNGTEIMSGISPTLHITKHTWNSTINCADTIVKGNTIQGSVTPAEGAYVFFGGYFGPRYPTVQVASNEATITWSTEDANNFSLLPYKDTDLYIYAWYPETTINTATASVNCHWESETFSVSAGPLPANYPVIGSITASPETIYIAYFDLKENYCCSYNSFSFSNVIKSDPTDIDSHSLAVTSLRRTGTSTLEGFTDRYQIKVSHTNTLIPSPFIDLNSSPFKSMTLTATPISAQQNLRGTTWVFTNTASHIYDAIYSFRGPLGASGDAYEKKWNYNFTSNSNTYTTLYIVYSSPNKSSTSTYMYYSTTSNTLVFNYDADDYNTTTPNPTWSWTDEAYKTITFDNSTDIYDNTLYSFLSLAAVQVS